MDDPTELLQFYVLIFPVISYPYFQRETVLHLSNGSHILLAITFRKTAFTRNIGIVSMI